MMNEGEVISLSDYKDKKGVSDILSDFIEVSIDSVDIKHCDKLYGLTLCPENTKYSYSGFQNQIYSVDYSLQQFNETIKLDYIAYLKVDGKIVDFKGQIILGTGRYEVDLQELIEERANKDLDKSILFTENPVKYDESKYEQEYKIVKIRMERAKKKFELATTNNQSYIRDYTKDPADVEVGDIIYTLWGYDTTQYSYYRVTERKAKSIKLEALATKYISGGGFQGECMPDDKVVPDNDIDGKLFRISNYGNIVCKIGNHYAHFWDGKPDSYNSMD